jgi:hypothetical protein
MCEQIASEPNSVVPKECKIYNEDDAQKAFNNEDKNKLSDEDSVEFNK